MASIVAVSNETKTTTSRVTKEGRHLTYQLEVIQQPERARACGSGAKSSADRRPVDPPPVVQLRIYEGDPKNDITFSHNANFFLFTTLEPARQIAHGRVSTTSGSSFPVLTGMPVAGMAYLDRPEPGGYFIFPDLSVRHEGKFRLSFNLYEEIKETKDEDAEPVLPKSEGKDVKPVRAQGNAPKNHTMWRLEVKSLPFCVYSAKKFPGLTESTSLSRVVAEQGCRVRIRRDVRMRRRDTKSKDYDQDYDENVFARPTRYTTPAQQIPERPRSISNGSIRSSVHGSLHGSVHGSVEPSTPYTLEHRRSSQDMNLNYNLPGFVQPPAPQQAVQPTPNYPSQLSFGSGSSQFTGSAFQPPSAPLSHTSQRYGHVSNDYQCPPNNHVRKLSASQTFAYSPIQPQTPTYQQPQTPIYPNNTADFKHNPEFRRTSLPANQQGFSSQSMNPYVQPDSRQDTSYPHMDARQTPSYPPVNIQQNPVYQQVQPNFYTPSTQTSNQVPRPVTPSTSSHVLPPIQTLPQAPENKFETSSPTTFPAPINGPSPSSSFSDIRSKYQPTYNSATAATNAYDPTRSTGKRVHDQVFDSSHQYQSIHNGMRPPTYNHGQDVPQVETDDGRLIDDYETVPMRLLSYRRADGSHSSKKCPSPVMD